jgi:WD40 repeat protein
MDLSPDGKYLAACSQSEAKIWNLTRPTVVGPQKFSLPGVRAVFSPDGTRIATAGSHGVKVWDATSGNPIVAMNDNESDATCVAFSPDGRRLAAAYLTAISDKKTVPIEGRFNSERWLTRSELPSLATLHIWDSGSGERILNFKPKEDLGGVWSLVFSPDGKRLATASAPALAEESYDPKLRIWDVESGEQILAFGESTSAPPKLAFSIDGNQIAYAVGNEKTVWNLKNGTRARVTDLPSTKDPSISPDGKRLVQVAFDPGIEVKIVDVQRNAKTFGLPFDVYSLPGKTHIDHYDSPRFSPDGTKIMIAGVGLGYELVQVWTSSPTRQEKQGENEVGTSPGNGAPIDRFDHAGGRFVREGPVWREYGHPDPTFAFYFREIDRDDAWLYLRDDSRGVDVKLPFRGGQMFLQYYKSSPGEWGSLYMVQPVRTAVGKPASETPAASLSKPIPATPTSIVRFEHSKGRFEKQGVNWIEYGNELPYTYKFRETSRDDKWIYVRDDSRAMSARFPLKGGAMYLHADDCHPDIWYPYLIVKPITADSVVPSRGRAS